MPKPRTAASAAGNDGTIRVAVCGAHMQGLPLNHQLTDRGATLVRKTKTTKNYRLYALPGGPPARPGMVRAATGNAIEVEVWELPVDQFGGFMKAIPAPLTIGTIEMKDGEKVKGFLCEVARHQGGEGHHRAGRVASLSRQSKKGQSALSPCASAGSSNAAAPVNNPSTAHAPEV